MFIDRIPVLKIGNLRISPPIIQGGMGVRVSGANSPLQNTGCAGIIASAGLGQFENHPGRQFVELNEGALKSEIRKAKSLSKGIIGVNIMVALSDYDDLVKTAVEEDVDLIIIGRRLAIEFARLSKRQRY